MPKPRLPTSGMHKFLYELEGLILNSKYLRNRFYQGWLGLDERDKNSFMRQVSRIAWKYMLGTSFRYALARTIIRKVENGVEVDVKAPLFLYMKKRFYRGDTRRMLIDLESYAQEVEKDREIRKLEKQRHVEKD